jgi:hypothetical protein
MVWQGRGLQLLVRRAEHWPWWLGLAYSLLDSRVLERRPGLVHLWGMELKGL